MKNLILEKWKNGEKSVGTFTHMQSAVALECIGLTGMDYAVIDMEHSSVVPQQAQEYIVAANAAGLATFVRVSDVSRGPILKMLDAGAQGVIVPCIQTVEEIKKLISYGKFSPIGNRGFCPTRDGGYGFAENAAKGIAEYMQCSNRETLLIAQCETLGCLENIEEITALDGLDGIMIGPFDLSIALDKPAMFSDAKVVAAIERVLLACKNAGKMAFIFTGESSMANGYFAQGFDSVILGLDTQVYIKSYKEMIKNIKR